MKASVINQASMLVAIVMLGAFITAEYKNFSRYAQADEEGPPMVNVRQEDNSPKRKQHPQNAELLRQIEKPDNFEGNHDAWKAFSEHAAYYPMEFKIFYPNSLILRIASEPRAIFIEEEWMFTEGASSQIQWLEREYGLNMFSCLIAEFEGRTYKVHCVLRIEKDNPTALAKMWRLMGFFFTSRGSTSDGYGPLIPIRNSTFTHNFSGDFNQSLTWINGNINAQIRVREETRDYYFTGATLGEMASRLSALFDPPPDDARDADPDGLIITVHDQDDDGPRIVVETPEDGPYNGWWLRLDTTAGRVSVEAPGRAVIKGMPEEGATITIYAISPDGKQWHRLSRDIK